MLGTNYLSLFWKIAFRIDIMVYNRFGKIERTPKWRREKG